MGVTLIVSPQKVAPAGACTPGRGLTRTEPWLVSNPAIPPVPPNSTPLRELAHAIADALTLPNPATTRDELTYLRIGRDRARIVRQAMRRILADREAEDRDVMITVASLRAEAAQLPDADYDRAPEPS
jgi:hypothetical protein